ncbi:MAG: hypothetical protein B7W98_02065 [Parcubacteria group bacterium 20-58-5]|nr:MAG: hypothetical protein B7W98_02065 [Parcubacteria group bacterium 20-58-5]
MMNGYSFIVPSGLGGAISIWEGVQFSLGYYNAFGRLDAPSPLLYYRSTVPRIHGETGESFKDELERAHSWLLVAI